MEIGLQAKKLAILFAVAVVFLWFLFAGPSTKEYLHISKDNGIGSWCPLPEPPHHIEDGLDHSSSFSDKASVLKQVERLSAAVNASTVSYNDNGDVDEDPRWNSFGELHEVLRRLFPLVHEKFHLEKVNQYGLLYTLQGSLKDLNPIVFMAHQDTVPAESPDKWTHPPFQAYYDGQWLWGRGSCDCKNNLIGILSAGEHLLSQNWKPKRTVILAFGFDEETGGKRGAAHIAAALEKNYGRDSLAMIMDEGGMGLQTVGDTVYALPGVVEKGYLDVFITLEVNGGHSSRPPRHSGIGIMAEMIVELEAHPFEPRLTQENPYRELLKCQVRYSANEVEPWLRRALFKNESEWVIGKKVAEARGNEARFSIQTSQAVDVIEGGGSTNQLPESVNVVVNYRIAPHDSLDIVKAWVARLLSPIAHKHGLAARGFGFDEVKSDSGTLLLSSKDDLPPSPISPTDDGGAWALFSGTIQQVFLNTSSLKHKRVVPVGDIMTGNTDTAHYWHLTRNIYRFTPARASTRQGVHTIDERVDINAHIEGMRVYYEMMRNFDNAK